jgi:DNA repair protein RecO (recombination protein O)
MIQTTKGIVLTHTRYGESSAIVHVYTFHFGMQSYMVNSVFSKKKKGNTLLLQPLNLLDMEVYHRNEKDLQRLKEFKLAHPLNHIPYSQSRRAQAFLITEILSRVLRNEGHNHELFRFIAESIEFLDGEHPGLENFHIWFLFNLTRFLGFYPSNNPEASSKAFDLTEGCYVNVEPPHPYILQGNALQLFAYLFNSDQTKLQQIAVNVEQRRTLLETIIQYYELHHQNIGKIRSLAILENLFSKD